MIVLSNSTAQTVAVGGVITFDTVVLHAGCSECHRANTGSVKLRANGIYDVSFSGNITALTGTDPVRLAMSLGGEVLPETTMIFTPSGTGVVNNVAARTLVKNCCGDYDRISVTNNGAGAVVVSPNASLVIKRVT